jgi:uncharacterized protein YydD (DUF2326 family)
MIRTITSPTISTFKRVDFHAGLNVLVADKTAASTNKQTRNSAGKTSLIEIIHFLFGADCDKDSLFRTPALLLHRFEGTFDLPEGTFVVERGGEEPSRIFLIAGAPQTLPVLASLAPSPHGQECLCAKTENLEAKG